VADPQVRASTRLEAAQFVIRETAVKVRLII
jgi:hypothetical protein